MSLFKKVNFTSHAGLELHWKIECDALTNEDWEALAQIAVEILPSFSKAVGIPRGGIAFADALNEHRDAKSNLLLIADDVLTTGMSFVDMKAKYMNNVIGVVAFCRNPNGPPMDWVTALFQIGRQKPYARY